MRGATVTRNVLLLGALLALVAAFLTAPPEAAAVPAFARQTGMACNACHFQHYPAINAFGRAFKMGGFTMKGAQSMVEADALSLPVALNASLVTKIRFQKTNGDSGEGTDFGELQFPDEAALLIGGRAGEHVGFLLELATFGEADTGSGEFSLFGSYKAHFNYQLKDVNVGAVIFSTDAGGAAYGFELLNTGAQRFQRVAEDRSASSAQQFVGLGAGSAEGIAFVASHRHGFANFSLWTPDHGNVSINSPAYYLRVAATPSIAGWDTGIGFQYFGGTASRSAGSGGDVDTKGWAVDAQAQGQVAKLPLGVYLSYAQAKPTTTNVFNADPAGTRDDRKAVSILAELGVIPNKWTLLAGYLDGDTGAATKSEDKRFLIGTTFMVAQNVEIQLSSTFFDGDRYDPKPAVGGDNLTTVMLFAAF